MLKEKIQQKNFQNINENQFLNKQFKYFDVANKGSVNFEQFSRAIEKIGVTMNQFELE
jgi:Ca2+-binding EF-hand superfamily protein